MKILFFMAHPDYHVHWFGGTAAKHARHGDEVYMVSACAGEMGQPDQKMSLAEFGKLKAEDADKAAKILGAKELRVLKYKDTEVLNTLQLRNEIMDIIRELKPDIVVSHWPNDGHPDITAMGQATVAACFFAPLGAIKSRHSAHKVKKIYSYEVSPSSIGFEPDYIVDISETMDTRIKAAESMKSVIDAELNGDVKKWTNISLGHAMYWGQQSGVKYAEPFREVLIHGLRKRASEYLQL